MGGMTVVVHPPTGSSALIAATHPHTSAPKQHSVAKTLLRSVVVGWLVVWAISWVLIAQTPAGAAESFAFGAMVGFWIGIGGGLIAGGAILSAREEH